MKSIKEIAQWYRNVPQKPTDLTPFQAIEWEEQNSKTIEEILNRSFEGEKLSASPAEVTTIEKGIIGAVARYFQDRNGYGSPILAVYYSIQFDNSFYEEIRQLKLHDMIEIEGEIQRFSRSTQAGEYPYNYPSISMTIKLTRIEVIEKIILNRTDIDDAYKNEITTKEEIQRGKRINKLIISSFLGGLIGLPLGYVAAALVGLIIKIINWFSGAVQHGHAETPLWKTIVIVSFVVLGILIGYFVGDNSELDD